MKPGFGKKGFEAHPSLNKALGQVFLRQEWPCVKLTELLMREGVSAVIEIGPGAGVLTKHLVSAGLHVTAVEKDTRFFNHLEEKKAVFGADTSGSLEVINEDILNFDLESWVTETSEKRGKVAVCGNIPYNISTPIVARVLSLLSSLEGAFFLVQLEFGQRVCSSKGSKNYGSLSVFSQLRSRAQLEFVVPRGCFYPVPKVDSAVISLKTPKKIYPEEILLKTETLTRQIFTQRRKKLSNACKQFLEGKDLERCPVDLSKRPDATSPSEFVDLAKFIYGLD